MKKTLITITTTLSAILIVSTTTYAIGTLTPSGTAGDNTQYSLNDIYTKLTSGTDASEPTGSISVPESVSASFRTLTEIYNSIPATLSINASTTTVPVGINRATTTLDAIDADLTAANIKDGVTVFGVEGTMEGAAPALEWSATNPSYVTWAQAISYCNNLVESDHDDWRLPTYVELVNAYVETMPGNSLNFQVKMYWSINEYHVDTTQVYIVDILDGTSYYSRKTNYPYWVVRCVR